jgi:mono/diheme cytochrome c family protein
MNVARHISRVLCVVGLLSCSTGAVLADTAQVQRGKYLVSLGGCTHCHTPGHFFGHDDESRFLGGSDVGFSLPDRTTVVGRNLTPDPETGLGRWSVEQIVTALRSGVRPDGRVLSAVMPWASYSTLSKVDAIAIAVYLKSLPPIRHAVPGPFGPGQKLSVYHMQFVPMPPQGGGSAQP